MNTCYVVWFYISVKIKLRKMLMLLLHTPIISYKLKNESKFSSRRKNLICYQENIVIIENNIIIFNFEETLI